MAAEALHICSIARVYLGLVIQWTPFCILCWISSSTACMEAYWFPAIMILNMRADCMQCLYAMANLTVTDKLRVIWIPTWVIRVNGVALVTFIRHITPKVHVVGINVVINGFFILVISNIITPIIAVLICC